MPRSSSSIPARALSSLALVALLALPGLPGPATAAAPPADPAAAPEENPRRLRGHEGKVNSIAFGPDGRSLVSGGGDHTVRLWDAKTGAETRKLAGHTNEVLAVAFRPDGGQVASTGRDERTLLWDPTTGKRTAAIEGLGNPGWSLAYSPDGRLLAVGVVQKPVRLWSTADGGAVRELPMPQEELLLFRPGSLAFRPDGTSILVGGPTGEIRQWNVETGTPGQPWELPRAGWGARLAFAPDGATVVGAGGWDARPPGASTFSGKESIRYAGIGALDPETGESRWRRTSDGHHHASVAIDPWGERVAAGGSDGAVRLFALGTGEPGRSLRASGFRVGEVAFSTKGSLLAAATDAGWISVWDLETLPPEEEAAGPERIELEAHSGSVHALEWIADQELLFSGSADETTRVWSVDDRFAFDTIEGSSGPVRAIAVSHDATRAAVSAEGGSIILYDLGEGESLHSETRENQVYVDVAFLGKNPVLAAASSAGDVTFWDSKTAEHLRVLDCESDGVHSMAVSPDGMKVATAGGDHAISLWHVVGFASVGSLSGHSEPVTILAFTPDGKHLVSATPRSRLVFWDIAEKQPARMFFTFGPVGCLAFRPDGRVLAIGGGSADLEDSRLQLLDVETGRRLLRIETDEKAHFGLAFSPDGETLAAGGSSPDVHLWDLGNESFRLGVSPGSIGAEIRDPEGREEKSVVEIVRVVEGQPAEKAGLLAGDIIISLNGRPTRGYIEFLSDLMAAGEGAVARLEVERGGEKTTIEVILAARPAGR